MAPPRLLPDDSELRKMHADGWSQQDIIDEVYRRHGRRVTKSAVSAAFARLGLSKPRKQYNELIPWTVRIEHNKHYAVRMLRAEARRRLAEAGGVPELSDDELRKLESWKRTLRENNAVVYYTPDDVDLGNGRMIPAGFHYVDPRQVDIDYANGEQPLIRVPRDLLQAA